MLLNPGPYVHVSQLFWHPETRTFCADISDIGGRFGRVWDDACDEGFTLVSRYSGKDQIVFAVDHTEVREGDVMYWDLKPAKTGLTVPFNVRIYND